MAVLTETAARWPHVATGVLEPLLTEHPVAARLLGAPALVTLAAIPGLSAPSLDAVEAAFPEERNPELDPALAAIAQRVADLRLAGPIGPGERIALLRRLGNRLSHAGKYDDALIATDAAVQAARKPETPEGNTVLATSLRDLAERLSHVDRREEALVAAEESTDLLRQLVATEGNSHLAELASAMNALAVTLGAVRRDEEALSATGEVVRIRRLLVARDPTQRAALAMALNNLSVDLSAADQMAQALVAGEESTALFETLHTQNPAPHEPDLAMALGNLGIRLLNVGRPQDALEPLSRSVELHRRLARDNPAFGPDLAWGLSTLAWALGAAGGTDPGRAAAAESAAQDALDLFELENGPLPTTFTDGRFEAIEALLGELDRAGHEAIASRIRSRLPGTGYAPSDGSPARNV